ncbi:MAG: hypothetical protein AAFX53_12440, partial [Bacteroidota bacterium]
IYKEQQRLREALEKRLQDMINTKDRNLGQKLLRQMENFENDLLENGVTTRTMTKVNRIQYELLKLENAALKQGQRQKRESKSGDQSFQNPILTRPGSLEEYREDIEILNRRILPLKHSYKQRVKEYFRSND